MYGLCPTYAVLMIACIQGKDLETIDLKRTGRSATAGLLIHGPLCHFWIQLMQTYLVSRPTWMNYVLVARYCYYTAVPGAVLLFLPTFRAQ